MVKGVPLLASTSPGIWTTGAVPGLIVRVKAANVAPGVVANTW